MIQHARQERLPRVTDANVTIGLGRIVSRASTYPAFVLNAPESTGAAYTRHTQRLDVVRRWMSERYELDEYVASATFDSARAPAGLHFDYGNVLPWGLNVHTTLAGEGLVYMARHNLSCSSLHYASGAYSDAKRRLSIGWPNTIDTDVVEPVVWYEQLEVGDTVVFPIDNYRSAEHPIGVWHEFTSSDVTGRLAVAGTLSIVRDRRVE
jgi:hypothetical protein